MSTVEVELHGSLAGSCIPGDTVTCVGLVKVLKTETATGKSSKPVKCAGEPPLASTLASIPGLGTSR